MTVCIGAIAAREKAIVMISDKAVTYGSQHSPMQTDTDVKKILPIGRSGWYALIAGDPTFAVDVVGKSELFLREHPEKADSAGSMMNCMKQAYQECREISLIDEVLTPSLMTKQLLVARPNTMLPLQDEHYADLTDEVRRYNSGCSLLICGFDKGKKPKPHVFSLRDPGAYENHDMIGYWAIGIGKNTAMARLLSMDTSKRDDLSKAIYGVFDAKVNAEIMQGVGYGWDAEVLPIGRNRSVPFPSSLVRLIDNVYSSFPRSPFDSEVSASPRNWYIKLGNFTRRIFPNAPNPNVIYFRRKPPRSGK